MRTALIVGAEGQDGTLLSQNLSGKGYRILKIGRSGKQKNDKDYFQFDLSTGDYQLLADWMKANQPEELYFLAAHHHSSQEDLSVLDFNSIDLNFKVNSTAFVNMLEIVRKHLPDTKIFYASSSLIFSATNAPVQDEQTAHAPNCFYSLAKSFSMQMAKMYRDNHGLFVATGILYNHESLLRKDYFLSKKIINDTHKLLKGEIKEIVVGSLSAVTDWGYAPDFVEAMHRILMQEKPDDYIIATGQPHKVEDWFKVLFGYLKRDWTEVIKEDSSLIKRKKPVLIGDNSKLLSIGWKPLVSFEEMVIRIFNNQI